MKEGFEKKQFANVGEGGVEERMKVSTLKRWRLSHPKEEDLRP
jgi:hypothetical protein